MAGLTCYHCHAAVHPTVHQQVLKVVDLVMAYEVEGYEDFLVGGPGHASNFDENGNTVMCAPCIVREIATYLRPPVTIILIDLQGDWSGVRSH